MFVVVVVVVVSRVLHRKYLKIIAALHYERWRLGGGGDNTQKLHNETLQTLCPRLISVWM